MVIRKYDSAQITGLHGVGNTMTPSSCITAHDHEEEALTGGNIVHNALKYPEANAFHTVPGAET